MTEPKQSLRDRILAANSDESVDELLAEGQAYQFAQQQTRRRWAKAAMWRKRQLKHEKSHV